MPLPYPTPSTKSHSQIKNQTREKTPADIRPFICKLNAPGTTWKHIYTILRENSIAYL